MNQQEDIKNQLTPDLSLDRLGLVLSVQSPSFTNAEVEEIASELIAFYEILAEGSDERQRT